MDAVFMYVNPFDEWARLMLVPIDDETLNELQPRPWTEADSDRWWP